MSNYVDLKRAILRSLKRRILTDDPVALANALNQLYSDHRQRLALLRSRSFTKRSIF